MVFRVMVEAWVAARVFCVVARVLLQWSVWFLGC